MGNINLNSKPFTYEEFGSYAGPMPPAARANGITEPAPAASAAENHAPPAFDPAS